MSLNQKLFTDRLDFVPTSDTDGVVSINAPQELEIRAANTQFIGKVNLGTAARFIELDDYDGNTIMKVDPATPQVLDFDGDITIDFNSCTVQNLAGSSVGQ